MLPPRLSFPLGLLLALAGASLSEAALAADPGGEAGASRGGNAELEFHIMAGEMAAGRQQPEVAAEEFLKALEMAPNAKLAARATQLALSANNGRLALTAARRWLSLEPNSLDAREVIIRVTLHLDLDDEAYDQCAAIVRDHPGGKEDGFRHVALLLSQESQLGDAALALMARLLAQYPKLAGAWTAQALLALRFDHVDLAEKSAREALRLSPNAKDAPLLLTSALVKKNDLAGADQIVDAQAKNSPSVSDLRIGYARLLIEANQRVHAREQLLKVVKADPAEPEAHLLIGLLALDDRRFDEAESHLTPLTRGGERASDAEYYLGRIAEARDQPKEALAHFEKVRSGNQLLDASVHRAAALARLGRLDEGRIVLGQLRQQYPPLALRFWLAEGDLLVEAKELEAALQLYESAIAQTDDPADLLYARSLVYEKLGRIAPAEADLRTLLAQNPGDSRAMNALGFMLVVHTQRLDEADQLLSKAIELTPDEPAVVDSVGWLRFRQGRQTEALLLLSRAYERFPDPEVAAHLGEALWASGDRDRAQTIWNRALKDAPDNTVLRETVKRLMP